MIGLFLLVSNCALLAPVSETGPRPPVNRPDPSLEEEEPDPLPPLTPIPDRTEETSPPSSRPVRGREAQFRQDIVEYAKTFQGTGYLYAGRDPDTGFDCSGFTYFVMKEFGIELTPVSRGQENQGRKVSVSRVQTGDLIFYRRSANTQVFHVSLVVDNDRDGIWVIHSTSRGVVIDNISKSSYWQPKISTARDVVSARF